MIGSFKLLYTDELISGDSIHIEGENDDTNSQHSRENELAPLMDDLAIDTAEQSEIGTQGMCFLQKRSQLGYWLQIVKAITQPWASCELLASMG